MSDPEIEFVQCPVTHRVLGRCGGEAAHPEGRGSSSHGSDLGWWDVRPEYTHWNYWAMHDRKPGDLIGGDDMPDGSRIERYADERGHVGETIEIPA